MKNVPLFEIRDATNLFFRFDSVRMESISNSGVSLILNPELAHAIDEQHHLSTCEEEFENPEEIQQVLANAFDSQSLSDTPNDDDDDEEEEDEQLRLLKEENESLRRQLTDSVSNEEVCRRRAATLEREIRESNEKHEEILFSTRLNFETKFEEMSHRLSEKQIEIVALKQKYETLYEEKTDADERVNEMRMNEEKLSRKPLTNVVQTQTVSRPDVRASSFRFSRIFPTRNNGASTK